LACQLGLGHGAAGLGRGRHGHGCSSDQFNYASVKALEHDWVTFTWINSGNSQTLKGTCRQGALNGAKAIAAFAWSSTAF
jgi:hypothetical protein